MAATRPPSAPSSLPPHPSEAAAFSEGVERREMRMLWGDARIYHPSFTSILLLHLLLVSQWLLMFTQKDVHRKQGGREEGARKEDQPAYLPDVAEVVRRKYALPSVMEYVGGKWWCWGEQGSGWEGACVAGE